MAKAICINPIVVYPFEYISKGDVVDYTVKNNEFIVHDDKLHASIFFGHFKVTNGIDKMSYYNFEYVLCNYVFDMAVLYPQEIDNGKHHLIIKDWDNKQVHISADDGKSEIYVSFNHSNWELYANYEDALEGIRNHKWN
jgi:hypothetical protein